MHKLALICLLLVLSACAAPADLAELEEIADEMQELEEQVSAECEVPVAAAIMLDAFPTTFESYAEVGEPLAEDGPGIQGAASTAARTLTINDEQYITYTGDDACGYNMNALEFAMLTPYEDEYGWTRTLQIAGYDARLSQDAQTGFYTVKVLLGERVMISTHGDGASEAQTIAAAQAVDYASIVAQI